MRVAMIFAFLCLAQAATGDEGFPSKPGARWFYAIEGSESMTVAAVGRRTIRGVETTVLRVQSGGSFFWTEHDLFVTVSPDGLLVHADSYADTVFFKEPPQLLLAGSLDLGKTWKSLSRNEASGSSFGFTATVVGREDMTVPAGTFRAWKIEYVLTTHLGTEYDLRAWFAGGVGFVKIEKWRESARGIKKEIPRAYSYELARFVPERRIPDPPRLTEAQEREAALLVGRLSDESPETREGAARSLAALGRGVIPFLAERQRHERSPEVRARIVDLLDCFKPLEVVGRLARERIKVGERLPVEFRVRNISERPISVLPALDASDVGWRHPKCELEIRDERGSRQDLKIQRCASVNSLLARDFVELLPGESLPPFWHYLLEWKPDRAGTYTVRFTYDTSSGDPKDWRVRREGEDPELIKLLDQLPKGRFESAVLKVVVQP